MVLADTTGWDNFVENLRQIFVVPDDSGLNYLTRILISLAIIVAAFFLIKLIVHILKKAFGIAKKGPEIDVSAKSFLVTLIKVLLWIGVALLVVSILKIDTTNIVGITSAITVALGLALQDLISCFASGILILQQHYIHTNDYIHIQTSLGETEGSVQKIHLFFTYLVTPGGQQIILPNNNVQKAIVTNYTTLGVRRLDYDVGVSYDADIELAKKVLHEIVDKDERILEEKGVTVYVYELGAYSVGLRIRVWAKFDQYWSLYNELSEKILLEFRKHNIRIPSSTDLLITKESSN